MKVLTSQMSVLKDFQKGIFTVGSLYKVLTPGPTLPFSVRDLGLYSTFQGGFL